MKRFNFVMPDELYEEVLRIANERHTDVTSIIKQFIKIGLLVNEQNVKVIITEGDTEREVTFISE